MATQKPVKVLCVGDVNGKFAQLIKRITTSGPFDVLFCVGEFFGPDDASNQKVVDGEVQFPVPTYILGPCCPSTSIYYPEESVEFSSSLTYLGRKGVLHTASGLSVGYLSGIEASSSSQEPHPFEFDDNTVDELLMPVRASSGFLGLDVLLTSMWPAQVSKHSPNQPPDEVEGSKLIARLAAGLKPRYHFAGRACHYERSPNHRVLLEPAQHVSRFIGLAPVDNPKKEKWLYAFSVTPMRKLDRAELTVQPPNCSEFPYMDVIEEFIARKQAEQAAEAQRQGAQFFFETGYDPEEVDPVDRGGRRKRQHDFGGGPRGPKQQNIQPDTCWFCLSNTGAEKHLIVSVGSHCYMAMPKGPLTEDHVMVLSIGHLQSLVAAPEEVRAEAARYRDAFSLMCDKAGKVLCVFERNYKTSHLQLQMVPVPKERGKAMRSAFIEAAQARNIELTFLKEDEQVWDLVNEGCPYFYAELPDGTRLFTRQMAGFPIQFGREVLADKSILNCEDKIDWRNCALEKAKEADLAKGLKQRFKPYDFAEDSDEDE
ncbi:Protein F17A9.2 [Aphelenchoides avenae]|nr:Protein F17A9.2 [Aphelenchus avenae]